MIVAQSAASAESEDTFGRGTPSRTIRQSAVQVQVPSGSPKMAGTLELSPSPHFTWLRLASVSSRPNEIGPVKPMQDS